MADQQIRIIIVEDHHMVRESLKQLLDESKKVRVIATCDSGAEAIKLAEEYRPDIILMDVHMSPIDGFESTKMITQKLPEIKVIGISMNNQPYYAEKMLRSGANGYVTKSSAFKEMIEAIEVVYRGKNYICTEVKKKMQ